MLRLLFSRKQFLNRGAVLLLPQAAFSPVRPDCFEISVRRRSASTGGLLIGLPGSGLMVAGGGAWRRRVLAYSGIPGPPHCLGLSSASTYPYCSSFFCQRLV